MSTVGMRSWKCPECGREVQLAATQLDPIACDECLAKMKSGRRESGSDVSQAIANPLGIWSSLPETTKLFAVVGALLVGLVVGYIGGQATSTHNPRIAESESTHSKATTPTEEPEERPPAPAPGYKWVRGRTHKDGTRGPGHWAKDPFYKGEDDSDTKRTTK